MINLALVNESLSRLAERVYRLEREREKSSDAHQDGRRRVVAFRICDEIDNIIFGYGSGANPTVRAKMEQAARKILEEHQC